MQRNFTFEISLRPYIHIYIYTYIYRSRLYDDVSKFMKTRYRVFPLSKSYIVARTIVIEDNKFFKIYFRSLRNNFHSIVTFSPPFLPFPLFPPFSNKKNLTIISLLNERGAKTGRGAIYRKHFFEVEMKILVKLDIA